MKPEQRVARELVKQLVASEGLVLSEPQREEQIADALADLFEKPDEDLAGSIAERLTALDGVDDLFASDEDIAAIVRTLTSAARSS